MLVLPQVELQRMAVLGGIGAVGAAVLVHIGVRLHVRVQHGLVDAGIVALVAAKRLGTKVVSEVVLQVVFILGNKGTFRTLKNLVVFDVRARVLPEFNLKQQRCSKVAVLSDR